MWIVFIHSNRIAAAIADTPGGDHFEFTSLHLTDISALITAKFKDISPKFKCDMTCSLIIIAMMTFLSGS